MYLGLGYEGLGLFWRRVRGFGCFCALRVPGFGPILAWGARFWAEGEYINDLVWPGMAWCGLVWPGCAGDPLAPIRTNVRMLFLVTHAEQEGRRISMYKYTNIRKYIYIFT